MQKNLVIIFLLRKHAIKRIQIFKYLTASNVFQIKQTMYFNVKNIILQIASKKYNEEIKINLDEGSKKKQFYYLTIIRKKM